MIVGVPLAAIMVGLTDDVVASVIVVLTNDGNIVVVL